MSRHISHPSLNFKGDGWKKDTNSPFSHFFFFSGSRQRKFNLKKLFAWGRRRNLISVVLWPPSLRTRTTLASKRSSGVFHIFFSFYIHVTFCACQARVISVCSEKKTAEFLAKKKNVEFSPFSVVFWLLLIQSRKLLPFFLSLFALFCCSALIHSLQIFLSVWGFALIPQRGGKTAVELSFALPCPILHSEL